VSHWPLTRPQAKNMNTDRNAVPPYMEASWAAPSAWESAPLAYILPRRGILLFAA
jgi:hypothetical protein